MNLRSRAIGCGVPSPGTSAGSRRESPHRPERASGGRDASTEPGHSLRRNRGDSATRDVHREPRHHSRPGDQDAAAPALDEQGVARVQLRLQGRSPRGHGRPQLDRALLSGRGGRIGRRPSSLLPVPARGGEGVSRRLGGRHRKGRALRGRHRQGAAPRTHGPRPQASSPHTGTAPRGSRRRGHCGVRLGLHGRGRSGLALDRARLRAAARNPSGRRAADATIDLHGSPSRLSAGPPPDTRHITTGPAPS